MKKINNKIDRNCLFGIFVLILTFTVGCKEDEDFLKNRGIILIKVINDETGQPVADANVALYRNWDAWALAENPSRSGKTNAKGEFVMTKLIDGEYFADVTKGSLNNYQNLSPIYTSDGQADVALVYVNENLHSIISSPEGKSWIVSGIFNQTGEDISEDENFSCLSDNTFKFYRSSYLEVDEGNEKCDEQSPDMLGGGWWGWSLSYLDLWFGDQYLYLEITEISESKVVGSYWSDEFGEEITIEFQPK